MGKKSSLESSESRLVQRLREGEPRALARTLSFIADGGTRGERCVELLYPYTGHAKVVGITGSPGAGKSTLVDALVQVLLAYGSRVGVIAVDPSSPFTHGAVLGDRIRMVQSAASDHVFIRSFATRGALGGLAPRTQEAVFAFDAAGFNWVIIETVGVGQGEVEIVRNADTVVLVLVPGMGDGVQALKAGIIEIADVFVINKADYNGADQLERDLLAVLALAPKGERAKPIVRTIATEGKGAHELSAAITEHQAWAKTSGAGEQRKEAFIRDSLDRALTERLYSQAIEIAEQSGSLTQALRSLLERKEAPSQAADRLLKEIQGNKSRIR